MTVRPYSLKGEITIFLALILSVVIGLLSVLIESAKVQAIRLNLEGIMDMSLHSCFGEYNQELLRRYDLIFVDSSYRGSKEPGIDSIILHLSEYLMENSELSVGRSHGDWYKEALVDVKADKYMLATDNEVFRNQAVEYIKEYGKVQYLPSMQENNRKLFAIKKQAFMAEWDKILDKINAFGIPLINPGKLVREMIVSDKEFLSGIELRKAECSNCVSKRALEKGKYDSKHVKNMDYSFFPEYCMQKFGCIQNKIGEQVLNGELEYLIYGLSSDEENLCEVIDFLLEKRESDNLACIKNNPAYIASAEALALSVVGEYLNPSLIKLVRDSIIYAWAYAEAALDVSRLISGGRCQIQKSSQDIELSVVELTKFRNRLHQKGGSGADYKDYIGAMLIDVKDSDLKYRSMDIIEFNIRAFSNDKFKMDGLFNYLSAEAGFESGYGYSHSIKRDYIYE